MLLLFFIKDILYSQLCTVSTESCTVQCCAGCCLCLATTLPWPDCLEVDIGEMQQQQYQVT